MTQFTRSMGDCMESPANFDAMPLGDLPLAMAYVPMQRWTDVSDGEMGLRDGTIFKELILPFKGRGVTNSD